MVSRKRERERGIRFLQKYPRKKKTRISFIRYTDATPAMVVVDCETRHPSVATPRVLHPRESCATDAMLMLIANRLPDAKGASPFAKKGASKSLTHCGFRCMGAVSRCFCSLPIIIFHFIIIWTAMGPYVLCLTIDSTAHDSDTLDLVLAAILSGLDLPGRGRAPSQPRNPHLARERKRGSRRSPSNFIFKKLCRGVRAKPVQEVYIIFMYI